MQKDSWEDVSWNLYNSSILKNMDLLFNKSIDQVRSLGIFKKVDTEIVDGSNENLKVIKLLEEDDLILIQEII